MLLMTFATATMLGGCAYFAVTFAPNKKPAASRSAAAEQADAYFWKTLHAGNYEDIPEALRRLKAAYLENPSDPVTAAHIGFLHLWRLSERNRLVAIPPGITDNAVLARKYFGEAVREATRQCWSIGKERR